MLTITVFAHEPENLLHEKFISREIFLLLAIAPGTVESINLLKLLLDDVPLVYVELQSLVICQNFHYLVNILLVMLHVEFVQHIYKLLEI